MIRTLVWVLVALVVLPLTVAVMVVWGMDIAHAIQGLYWPEQNRGYAFFSSFGYTLFTDIFIGTLYLFHHNCHQRGCVFVGRFPAVEGGGWHYCRRHHRHDGVHK